jgi:hypothetical protein
MAPPASPDTAVPRAALRVVEYWHGLTTMGRIVVVAVPVIVSVGIIAAVVGLGSRDEGSYQYGRSAFSNDARMLLSTNQTVGQGAARTAEDACRIVVDSSMKVHTAQADSMRNMDKDEMIAGCTDAVNGD